MVDLKELREKKKLTQEQLAEKVGVTRQAIGMIENGHNQPSVALAKKLGKVLKVRWVNFFND